MDRLFKQTSRVHLDCAAVRCCLARKCGLHLDG
jgi:hypothetical protein